MFNRVDRELISCAKKPECFLEPESAWVEPPKDARTFNPSGAVLLPDPTDGEVAVFSFRVPIGYDGVILGQYNMLTANVRK
jgi:hypothetical protein